jgi:hypothetical protein
MVFNAVSQRTVYFPVEQKIAASISVENCSPSQLKYMRHVITEKPPFLSSVFTQELLLFATANYVSSTVCYSHGFVYVLLIYHYTTVCNVTGSAPIHATLRQGHFHVQTILQSAVTNLHVTTSDTECSITRVRILNKKERKRGENEEKKYDTEN